MTHHPVVADDGDLDDATLDLFGLGSPTVAVALSIFTVVYVVVSVGAGHDITAVSDWVGLAGALAIFVVATGLVVRARGAQSRVAVAIVVVGLALCGLAIALWSLPPATYLTLQTSPPVSAVTIVLTMVALHGRPVVAWTGTVGCTLVAGVWGHRVGFGFAAGAEITFFCYPVMVVATLFVIMARPMVIRIRMLRESAIGQAAAEAATAAGAAERNRQLRRLDRRARPILQKIVAGHEFTAAEVADARLTEAQLRDGIRARAWESEQVREAVWRARRRGVSVLLLDDGVLSASADDGTLRRLHGVLIDALRSVDGGQVTARVLPPGRTVVASIVVNAEPSVRRIEYGVDGRVSVHTGTLG